GASPFDEQHPDAQDTGETPPEVAAVNVPPPRSLFRIVSDISFAGIAVLALAVVVDDTLTNLANGEPGSDHTAVAEISTAASKIAQSTFAKSSISKIVVVEAVAAPSTAVATIVADANVPAPQTQVQQEPASLVPQEPPRSAPVQRVARL